MPEDDQKNQSSGMFGRLMSMSNDSIAKTVFMTVLVCLVCAVVVATAAVALKEKQETNKLVDKQQNILQVAGLDDESMSVEDRFSKSTRVLLIWSRAIMSMTSMCLNMTSVRPQKILNRISN